MKRLLSIAMCSTFLIAGAYAAELKPYQKAALTKFNEEMKDPIASAEKACGGKFNLKFDIATYKKEQVKEWEGNSISGRCEAVFSALSTICGDENYKPEVTKNIKTVECKFGGKEGDTAQNMKVNKGTFTFAMHVSNGNLEDAVKSVVKSALDE